MEASARIGRDLEAWAVEAVREAEIVPEDFQVLKHAEDARANGDRIVFTAEVGGQDEGGCEPYAAELEARLVMTERDSETANIIFRDVLATIRNPPITASLLNFSFLVINSEEPDEIETRRDIRDMRKTFSVLAKES